VTLLPHPVTEGEGAPAIPVLGLLDAPSTLDLLATDDGPQGEGHQNTLHLGGLLQEDLHQGEADVLGPPPPPALTMSTMPEEVVIHTSLHSAHPRYSDPSQIGKATPDGLIRRDVRP